MKTFGQPGSITPASFRTDLHPATIIEGLALLREMGLTRKQMREASGYSERTIRRHLATPAAQIRLPDGRADRMVDCE
ncbi:hypothetical protein ABE530_16485 [Brucella sp. TWI559]